MKTGQSICLQRVMPTLAGPRWIGAALLLAAVSGLVACGGGSDDEAGTPLVPVTPGSSSSANAASAPGG